MENKQSGQALIEFVMILPILILLIFSMVDFGRIILENNRLENLTNVVIDKYKETKDKDQVEDYLRSLGYNNIDLNISQENGKLTIKITRSIDIVTPGLGTIFGDPYQASVKRVVNYEE